MKSYVITLSQQFPAKHPRKGEPNNFNAQLLNAVWKAHNMSRLPAIRYEVTHNPR